MPMLFVWHYWHEARTRGWDWISEDSRSMYVDGAKTLITASGIAVALLASSAVSSARTANHLMAFSAKVAVVCLISCVCLSLILILALLRGFERAKNRYIDEQRKTGKQIEPGEGKLNTAELLFILVRDQPRPFLFPCRLRFPGQNRVPLLTRIKECYPVAVPEWRNWQTRRTQNPVAARP